MDSDVCLQHLMVAVVDDDDLTDVIICPRMQLPSKLRKYSNDTECRAIFL